MPQSYTPSFQDWAPVNAGKGGLVGSSHSSVPKTAREVDAAKAAGIVATEKRYGAGSNKSAHTASGLSIKKLEDADDVGTFAKVDKNLSKAIMAARTAKKLTQKELATAINEKPQVIADYESGKAYPNPQIISKLERKLGVKLPRPGKSSASKPTAATGSTGTTTRATAPLAAGTHNGMTRGGPPKRR